MTLLALHPHLAALLTTLLYLALALALGSICEAIRDAIDVITWGDDQ